MRIRTTGVAALSLGIAAGLTLAGCGSSSSGTSAGATATAGASTTAPAASGSATAQAASGNPLVIWADDQRVAVLKPFAAQFEQQYGVKVSLRAFNVSDLQSDFVTASAHGSGPDIVVLANDAIGNLVQNGAIAPVQLTSAQQAAFEPTAIKAMTYDGQVYGVPYAIENIALIRNTSLAPTAPTTIDQLVSEGKQLKSQGKVKNALCLQSGTAGDAYHIFPFYTAGGGQLFGTTAAGDPDPKQVLVGSSSSVSAWAKLRALGSKGSGALTTAINSNNAIPAFTSKACAFLISGPWAMDAIKAAHIKYDISNIPAFSSSQPARPFLGVQAFFVAAKGKNVTLAQQFVTTYVTKPSVQEALYQVGARPEALIAALDASKQSDPDIAKWEEAGADGEPMPDIPAMAQVWVPFGNAEVAVINGTDPATAAKAAATAIEKAIASS